jgi:formyl-CoA transferase
MFADPHFAAREAIVRVAHPDFGELAMQNVAPKLSDTPGAVRSAGPELGRHNHEIYHGLLGLTQEETDRLSAGGIISRSGRPAVRRRAASAPALNGARTARTATRESR